jgi:hypothetical protein
VSDRHVGGIAAHGRPAAFLDARPAPVRVGCHFLAAWPWLPVSAGRLQPRAPHPIPMMRVHLPAHDYALIDSAPARYTIRLSGHLGATVLSAFPALESQLSGAEPCSPGSWTGRRYTALWPRSKRSVLTSSKSAGTTMMAGIPPGERSRLGDEQQQSYAGRKRPSPLLLSTIHN